MLKHLFVNIDLISCPDKDCANHGLDLSAGKSHYHKFGETDIGSKRYRCKACGKTFSVRTKPTARQRLPHKNKMILKMLVNRAPIRRICEMAEVSVDTVYRKIDYLHGQCLAFVGERERRLVESGFSLPKLYLASDRQEYIVNWSNTNDKRNVILKAVGTADMRTRYVFAMHVNHDPALDPNIVRREVLANGDALKRMPFRDYARVWLEADHAAASRVRNKSTNPLEDPIPMGLLPQDIERRYEEALERDEIEASDDPEPHIRLPHEPVLVGQVDQATLDYRRDEAA